MFHLLNAVTHGASLADIVFNCQNGFEIKSFASLHKDRIYIDHENSREIDIPAVSEAEDGADLAVEVKNWKKEVSTKEVKRFIELKKDYAGALKKKTGFVLYSEQGFTDSQEKLMEADGVMYTTPHRLTAYLRQK